MLLGIYLNTSLSWARQVHKTCLRANRKLAILRSVRYLKRSTLDLLYKVCVRSTIEYGLVIYWHTLKPTEAARINQIQYRAAKICTGALHFSSQSKLEEDLSWETIDSRAKFLGLTIFHKVHLGLTRPLVKACMPQRNSNNTRGAGRYVQSRYFNQKYNNSFFPLFSTFWSKLKTSIRNDFDIISFKDKLKSTFKPKRQKHFNCGEKLANSLLCRMRIGRSYLKSHSFAINLSSSDRCFCGAIDDNKHLLLFCFIFQEERHTMMSKIVSILPNFHSLPISKQVFILLNGINLDSLLPDPRNRLIMFAVQKFITQTNRFSKHYE